MGSLTAMGQPLKLKTTGSSLYQPAHRELLNLLRACVILQYYSEWDNHGASLQLTNL